MLRIQLSEAMDDVLEVLRDPSAKWGEQVQALRELQAIAEGDSVYSSAQRQQQLADELFPELPTIAALVQDRRPSTARQACTTVESLAESLQEAFDPFIVPLLPSLLVVASSSTPALARSAESGVITVMRSCTAERKTALLCWAAGGLATGIWEEAPHFRSTPDAIVRRQSLWLVLMLLELAEADNEVEVEALARQLSDALDIAELSKRAETRAIGQHARTVLQRRLARTGHAPAAPNFVRAPSRPARAQVGSFMARATNHTSSSRGRSSCSTVKPSFYETYVSPYDQGLLRHGGGDAPPPPRRRHMSKAIASTHMTQSFASQHLDLTAVPTATGGLRKPSPMLSTFEEASAQARSQQQQQQQHRQQQQQQQQQKKEEEEKEEQEEVWQRQQEQEPSQLRRLQVAEASRVTVEEQLAVARKELMEFRARAQQVQQVPDTEHARPEQPDDLELTEPSGLLNILPTWSQALGLESAEQCNQIAQPEPALPRQSSRRLASESSPLPHWQLAPPPPTPPQETTVAHGPAYSAMNDVDVSPAPSSLGMTAPKPTEFHEANEDSHATLEIVVSQPGPLGLSLETDAGGQLLVSEVKSDGMNAHVMAPLRNGSWRLIGIGNMSVERAPMQEVFAKLRSESRPIALQFAAATIREPAQVDRGPQMSTHYPALQSLPTDGAEPYRLKVRVAEDLLAQTVSADPAHLPDQAESEEERSRAKKKKRGARHRKQQKVAETAAPFGRGYSKRYTDRLRRERQKYEEKRQREQDGHNESSESSDFESSCSSDQCTDVDKGDKANSDKVEVQDGLETVQLPVSDRQIVQGSKPSETKTQRSPVSSKKTGQLSRYLGKLTDSTRTIDRAAKPEAAGRTQIQSHTEGKSSKTTKKQTGPDLSVAVALLTKLQTIPEVQSILDDLGVTEASDLGLLDEYDLTRLAKHCPKVTFHKLAAEWSDLRARVLTGSIAPGRRNRSEARAVALELLADALVEEEEEAAHQERLQNQRQQGQERRLQHEHEQQCLQHEHEQQRLQREREQQQQKRQQQHTEEEVTKQLSTTVSQTIAALHQSEAVRRARTETQRTAAEDPPAAFIGAVAGVTAEKKLGTGDKGDSLGYEKRLPAAQALVPVGELRITSATRKVARSVPNARTVANTVPTVGQLRQKPAKRGIVVVHPKSGRDSPRPWDESIATQQSIEF